MALLSKKKTSYITCKQSSDRLFVASNNSEAVLKREMRMYVWFSGESSLFDTSITRRGSQRTKVIVVENTRRPWLLLCSYVPLYNMSVLMTIITFNHVSITACLVACGPSINSSVGLVTSAINDFTRRINHRHPTFGITKLKIFHRWCFSETIFLPVRLTNRHNGPAVKVQ